MTCQKYNAGAAKTVYAGKEFYAPTHNSIPCVMNRDTWRFGVFERYYLAPSPEREKSFESPLLRRGLGEAFGFGLFQPYYSQRVSISIAA